MNMCFVDQFRLLLVGLEEPGQDADQDPFHR
jgi:hypothetical protein